MAENRKLYNGAHRLQLEEDDSPNEPIVPDQNNATPDEDLNSEERSWKKRYSDLRSFNNNLTERVKSLENQLRSASKKEIQFPATREEVGHFAGQYPDVFRYIRSMIMTEMLQERESLNQETNIVKENLEKVQMKLGKSRILEAHPDFDEINLSQDFHDWVKLQPMEIQDWAYRSSDPELCIRAIDWYKAENDIKKKPVPKPPTGGADLQVKGGRAPPEIGNGKDGTIWKASDIAKLTPKEYLKFEAEIDKAHREGRIDNYA